MAGQKAARARYIARSICAVMEKGARSIEVTADAYSRYNEAVDQASEEIVWKLAPKGRNYYLMSMAGSM